MALTSAQLLDYFNSHIKLNGRQEITGDIMNYALVAFKEYVDAGFLAVPSTNMANSDLLITDAVRKLKLNSGSGTWGVYSSSGAQSWLVVDGAGVITMAGKAVIGGVLDAAYLLNISGGNGIIVSVTGSAAQFTSSGTQTALFINSNSYGTGFQSTGYISLQANTNANAGAVSFLSNVSNQLMQYSIQENSMSLKRAYSKSALPTSHPIPANYKAWLCVNDAGAGSNETTLCSWDGINWIDIRTGVTVV